MSSTADDFNDDSDFSPTEEDACATTAEGRPNADEDELPLPDVLELAASLMLDRALDAAAVDADRLAQNGSVVVMTVSAGEWLVPCLDAWKRAVSVRGRRPVPRTRSSLTCRPSQLPYFAEAELPKPAQLAESSGLVANAIGRGVSVFGISHDLKFLPQDLLGAADLMLVASPLTSGDVARIASLLTGTEPSAARETASLEGLTPRQLQLAVRRSSSADEFLSRLAILVENERRSESKRGEVETSLRTAPTLDRLHGMDEAVEWGLALRRDLEAYTRGNIGWESVSSACLLSGDPGCGKTTFAKALARTFGIPLVSGSYATWHASGSAHQGDLLKAMRRTFGEAKEKAPSILFIDEVDSFPDRGSLTHAWADWEIQVVNALLAEIDGVEGREGVVVMAACNHPEKLDPALMRPGRLDTHIRIPMPSAEALALMVREHLGEDLAGIDLASVGLQLLGSTGADCERLVRCLRGRARAAERAPNVDDLVAELCSGDRRSAEDIRLVAVHEAGHAAAAFEFGIGIEAATIRSSAHYGGVVRARFEANYPTLSHIQDRLAFILAGRAAEEILLGTVTAAAGGGRSSDLALATSVAASAVTDAGLLADAITWTGLIEPGRLAERLDGNPGLAERTQVMLADAYGRACKAVRKHHNGIDVLAKALTARYALSGKEVSDILSASRCRSKPTEEARYVPPRWLMPLPPSGSARVNAFVRRS